MARKQGKRRRRSGISQVKKTPNGTTIRYKSGTTVKWKKGSQKPEISKRDR